MLTRVRAHAPHSHVPGVLPWTFPVYASWTDVPGFCEFKVLLLLQHKLKPFLTKYMSQGRRLLFLLVSCHHQICNKHNVSICDLSGCRFPFCEPVFFLSSKLQAVLGSGCVRDRRNARVLMQGEGKATVSVAGQIVLRNRSLSQSHHKIAPVFLDVSKGGIS